MDEEIMADGVLLRLVVKLVEVKEEEKGKINVPGLMHNPLDEIMIEEFDIIKHEVEAGNRFYNEKWPAPA